MKVKFRVGKGRKEEGVSEVLGSILVLLITVTLFSSVFYYVNTIETPNPRIYAQFDANMKILQDSSGNYYINITVKNVGGESLEDWKTMFIVVIDFTAKQHMLSEANFASQPFDSDHKFSQGESLYYDSRWDGFTWDSETAVKALDITVTLYDNSGGEIIWSTKLQGRTNVPPILISLTSRPTPIKLGEVATLKATIFDPDESDDISTYKVGLDFSLSNLSQAVDVPENPGINPSYVPMSYSEGSLFVRNVYFADLASLDVTRPYPVRVYIDDGVHNITTVEYVFISRGTEVRGPDLYLNANLTLLSNSNPTKGDSILVTLVVQNRGGMPATFNLRVYDNFSRYPEDLLIVSDQGNPQPSGGTYSVGAGSQVTISFEWNYVAAKYLDSTTGQVENITYNAIGTHYLRIEAINITPSEDPLAKEPNYLMKKLNVLPKILFVDADQAIEGTSQDVSKYYQYILSTCNYNYDIRKIMGTTEVPLSLDYLEQYDVVIWETGFHGDYSSEDTSPISKAQMEVLYDYYSGGKSLWLISQEMNPSIMADPNGFNIGGAVKQFSGEVTGVSNPDINLTLSTGNEAGGTLINRSKADNNDDSFYFSSLTSPYRSLMVNSSTGEIYAIYANQSNGARFVYFGFELSRIDHYYIQYFIAYRVLNWLAGISGMVGNDVAVDDMSISPQNPLYMQEVNITVVISNNGENPLQPQVLLEVDGERSGDVFPSNMVTVDSAIEPNGGFAKVYFTWIPTSPGIHTISVYVDPNNLIRETNEDNNMLDTSIIDNTVYVRFSTVVVYNSTTGPTQEVDDLTTNLANMNYPYTLVNVADEIPEGYREGTYFQRYNLVTWVVDSDTSMGTRDVAAITNSLNSQRGANINFLFVGESVATALSNYPDLQDAFNVVADTSTSLTDRSIIYGVNNEDSVTNGLAYIVDPDNAVYAIAPQSDDGTVKSLFPNALSLSAPITAADMERYYLRTYSTIPSSGFGVVSLSSAGGKAAFLPFDISDIRGIYGIKYDLTSKMTPYAPADQARVELLYHLFNYFGEVTYKPELAVYSPEITIKYGGTSDLPLIVGRSYMVRAIVHNYGNQGTSAVIRFYEDYNWIGGQTIYVPAKGTVTVEIPWTPLAAGNTRHLIVIVDPLNEVEEVTWASGPYAGKEVMNYNNEAILTKRIFFFWDNMEQGTSNWRHEATIMDINGESPIDYLGPGYETTYTNIISSWDDAMSVGLWETDSAFHSAPNSFWLQENSSSGGPIVTTTRIPVDMVFAIDSSGSMAWDSSGRNVGASDPSSRWYQAKTAVKNFIDELTPQDRAAIWVFDGNGHPYKLIPTNADLAYMTDDNKTAFKNALDNYDSNVGGSTPFYDTLGKAIENALVDDSDATNNDRLEFVIGLTDGESNSDTEYSPKANWGEYTTEGGGDSGTGNYKGLLHAPPMVFTIGVCNDNLHPSGDAYPEAPDWSHDGSLTDPDYEYDMWHVADSSNWPWGKYGRDYNVSDYGYSAMPEFQDPDPFIGHYYYTDDATKIGDIFSSILEMVKSIASSGTAPTGNVTAPIPSPDTLNSAGYSLDATATETWYMRSDQQTVNGLTAYKLSTTQSSSYTSAGGTASGYTSGYWGIRVWIRHADGTEDELTPGYSVAVVSRNSDGEGMQSATWNCPGATLSSTDSIVVRVYIGTSSPPSYQVAEFTTQPLTASRLYASTWTVYYYTYLNQYWWGNRYTDIYYYWGDSTHNSRISNVQYEIAPPSVLEAYPADGKIALKSQYVAVVFDQSMDTNTEPTLTQTAGTDPGDWHFEGWFTTYKDNDTAIWSHANWTDGDSITLQVSNYKSQYGDVGNPYSWSFNILVLTSSGGNLPPGNSNKTAVTPVFDISNTSSAYLTFWHKYNIVAGTNGAFIEIGYKDPAHADSTGWAWKYVIPTLGAYTGNLKIGVDREDSFGNQITWGWNGMSGGGSFTWEFVKVDLLKYVPAEYRDQVRIKFNYTQYGAGTGYGWYIDDVKVVVTRAGDDSSNIGNDTMDVWQYVTTTDRYGNTTHAWWNGDPTTGYFRGGIDNSLSTVPIDLTSAYSASFSAYFKFNINTSSGAPPDGFRVEVSLDNGLSWIAINLGVRAAWGVSATGSDSDDGTIDGKSYTGLPDDSKTASEVNYWVSAGTLTRLNVDLSAFSGNVILLRFRVVTTSASSYQHYDQDTGWGGFYVDDVVVKGESTSPVITPSALFYV